MTQYPEELASHDRPLQSRGWGLVEDAVRGTSEDYTEGPIGRSLVLLAVPMVLETVMESVFALADVFWVSRLGAVASWIVLVRILSDYGTEVVAGYTIAVRLVVFALLPSWGLSNAAATMVGQALGAGKPDRAERAARLAGVYNMVFLGSIGIVFAVFAPTIVSWFTTEPVPLEWGARGLRIIACGFPFYAWGMVLTQSFNGAGDTWTPTWIALACFWGIEQPAAWILSRGFDFGPTGVFLAITVAYSAVAVVSAILFRRGGWKGAEA